MQFIHNERTLSLISRLNDFMAEHIYPNEQVWDEQMAATAVSDPFSPPPILEELKQKAREADLWNLFMPDPAHGHGLSNVEYAPLAEIMGRVIWSPEVFNCNAPDTGNMELLHDYGTPQQQEKWLKPLMEGKIRSCYVMTEPAVASSDATNIELSITRDGDDYVLNGRKWFITGAMDERAKIFIVMGKSDPTAPTYNQQSQILVPRDTPGITIMRPLPVLHDTERPGGHAEIDFKDVRVPAENMILGEGRGFEIAQGRLGPGRIHHCMRTIGLAERALEQMCDRLLSRTAFGSRLADLSYWQQKVADARNAITQARLLTLNAAYMMDTVGNKEARAEIAQIKVVVPRMAQEVIDTAIQAFGAAGLTNDFHLATMYATARWVRLADGPDEVHNRTVAKVEFKKREAPVK